MVESNANNALSGFARYLSENKILDKEVALNALQESIQNKQSYIEYLIKKNLIEEPLIAKSTADYFGFPLCDITAFNSDLIPSEYLNIQIVKKKQALPLFKKSGLIYLAIIDPTVENLYELRFLTGMDIRFLIVESSKLIKSIDSMQSSRILSEISVQSEGHIDNITVNAYKDEEKDLIAHDIDSAPVVNYVNRILLDAIERGASDIHFECFEDSYRIRFRQHGVLYSAATPPIKLANYLIARIKIMSNLDITEHRIPQDGRFKLIISHKRSIDFRVSVCPTLFGEKVVLRILNPAQLFQGVHQLGMDTIQEEAFKNALQHSQGMILVTGPTGSGKTVTLYSALSFLNSIEKNISTVEDPVEIPLHGINQVHVNPKIGLTFSSALRSFLRQDPDIMMIGEIRDIETAEIAVKAAQTGHLVLSTLHTNSASETITRLMNIGIAPYNLASSLILIIAQRLVRILCENCKQKESIPKETLLREGFKEEDIPSLTLYGPSSCNHCLHGYNARKGIFEVMPISKEMVNLIEKGSNVSDIVKQTQKENIISLRESGLKLVREGLTSLTELNRVFK